jgi:hypothetical protein
LQNYRVKVKGGQVAKLSGKIYALLSAAGYADIQWYDVTNAAYVGVYQEMLSSVYSAGNYIEPTEAVARVSPLVDTEYELRVKALAAGVTITSVYNFGTQAFVESTLPNASVTSQVIKKETVATNTTAWTVTLPVACKAIRIHLSLNNVVASNLITLGANGTSTGYRQYLLGQNGTTVAANHDANTYLAIVNANRTMVVNGGMSILNGSTWCDLSEINDTTNTSFVAQRLAIRIDQAADISSIVITGDKTNGIGAGSYIIVERVDADLSQDLGWQSYTPTCYIDLTSATTVPNITPSVRYRVQGKTLFMQGTLNFTGAPTGATDLAISLPVGVNIVSLSSASKLPYAGNAGFTGVGTYQGRVRLPMSTENRNRIAFRPQTGIGTVDSLRTTVPFTWANGHQVEFDLFTEIE